MGKRARGIRVLLADDHDLLRAGIRSLLGGMAGIEVVGEASNGREAIELIKALKPDVVLMDIIMPELNGLEAIAQATRQVPTTKIIVLSMNAAEEYVLHAMRAGAAGYLLKNISPQELDQAIRCVARGETYLTSAVSQHVINGYLQRAGDVCTTLERLTPRQREILQLVAEGNTTKEIAVKLANSVKTVETLRSQLMKALDIHDIAGLVRYAIRMGIITAEK